MLKKEEGYGRQQPLAGRPKLTDKCGPGSVKKTITNVPNTITDVPDLPEVPIKKVNK
ncbi:hypothetical protein GCM10028773_28830 [Spirosoma koreense]